MNIILFFKKKYVFSLKKKTRGGVKHLIFKLLQSNNDNKDCDLYIKISS